MTAWDTLGSKGRGFIDQITSSEDFEYFFPGEEYTKPLRVYVGLNSAETLDERAELLLSEMIRVGAFSRSTLVLVTPT